MLANTTAPGAHTAAIATASASSPAAEALASNRTSGHSGGDASLRPAQAAGKNEKTGAAAKGNKANGAEEDGSFASALKHARDILTAAMSSGVAKQDKARGGGGEAAPAVEVARAADSKEKAAQKAQGAAKEKVALAKAAALKVGTAAEALQKGVKHGRHPEDPGGASEKESAANAAAAEDIAKDRKKKPAGNEALILVLSLASPGDQASKVAQLSGAEAAAEKLGHGAVGKKNEPNPTEPKVSVADLRRSVQGRSETAKDEAAKAEAGASAQPAKDLPRDLNSQHSSDKGEMFRDLMSGNGANATEAKSSHTELSPAPARGMDFQSLLAQRLHDSWNGEIVKSAHIVLKDGDSGLIRLRLKPESLGDVKIELNLSDKNISGKIVVQSDEAKHAFERNMNDLADAFRQGGFDSARLEVSVGSGSQQGNRGSAGGDSASPFFSGRLRSDIAPAASSQNNVFGSARRGAVDILA
jgi:flagellar hook-length control protein FliK